MHRSKYYFLSRRSNRMPAQIEPYKTSVPPNWFFVAAADSACPHRWDGEYSNRGGLQSKVDTGPYRKSGMHSGIFSPYMSPTIIISFSRWDPFSLWAGPKTAVPIAMWAPFSIKYGYVGLELLLLIPPIRWDRTLISRGGPHIRGQGGDAHRLTFPLVSPPPWGHSQTTH